MVKDVVRVRARRRGLVEQAHIRLARRAARLAVVARDAGAHHIPPSVLPVARAREYVVKRQVAGGLAAVLAAKAVAVEYGAARQPPPNQRALDHIEEAYHRGNRHAARYRGYVVAAVYQRFGFAAPKQDYRPPRVADVEGLVVLVQNQHRLVQQHRFRSKPDNRLIVRLITRLNNPSGLRACGLPIAACLLVACLFRD